MEASKVMVGGKTFDLNYMNKAKKTNLRRKLIIEYIQSKPAGEYIKMLEFQRVGQFKGTGNTHMFIKRMIRDGVIAQCDGDKPKSHYYAVTGSIRVKKSVVTEPEPQDAVRNPDINAFVSDMQKLGVGFTITISNKEG